jgi:cell division protein FtsB
MPKINTKKVFYNLRWRYITLNNVILAIAFVIGANWVWGSIEMMQRNYTLQRTLDLRQREQTLAELEVATLAFEKRYYESDEYKELAARQHLGLAAPGEKVLILPPAEPVEPTKTAQVRPIKSPSNYQQWMNFLLGKNRRSLQK